jgi:hypothetical protein
MADQKTKSTPIPVNGASRQVLGCFSTALHSEPESKEDRERRSEKRITCENAIKEGQPAVTKAFGKATFAWPMSTVLTVGFFNANEYAFAITRVKKVASQWFQVFGTDQIPGIKIDWTDDLTKAVIRIRFVNGEDSWSLVGTRAKAVLASEPTMQIGLGTPADLIDATILHEFGHVYGFEHEHQNPLRPFTLNAAAILMDPMFKGWTSEMITENIIQSISDDSNSWVTATFYDPHSIMHYRLPPHWLKDAQVHHQLGGAADRPVKLSKLDWGSFWQLYPPVPWISGGTQYFPTNPFGKEMEAAGEAATKEWNEMREASGWSKSRMAPATSSAPATAASSAAAASVAAVSATGNFSTASVEGLQSLIIKTSPDVSGTAAHFRVLQSANDGAPQKLDD